MSPQYPTSRDVGFVASADRLPVFLKPLDGLRGVAALCVVLYHLRDFGHLADWPIFGQAYLFVDLFFVLSGFVIYHVYAERIRGVEDARTFLVLRLARIYPLHVVTLLSVVAFTLLMVVARDFGLISNPFGARTVARDGPYEFALSLGLLHGMGFVDRQVWSTVSWSISAEFFAYLTFAFLALMGAWNHRRCTFVVLTTVVCGLAFLAAAKPNLDVTYDYGFIRCLCGFGLGILVCRRQALLTRLAAVVPDRQRRFADIVVVAGVILYLAMAGGKGSFVAPFVFAAVLVWCLGRGGWLTLALGGAVGLWLGKVSYSVYLNQVIVLTIASGTAMKFGLQRGVAGDVVVVVAVACILAGSELTYRWIEAPSRHAIRQWWATRSVRVVS